MPPTQTDLSQGLTLDVGEVGEDSKRGRYTSPSPAGRAASPSFRSVTSLMYTLEEEMLELLRSDLAAGVPQVKDSGFIGDIHEKICAGSGEKSFGSDQLQLFMLETLGLPEEDLRGTKAIVREIARGADEVTAEKLGSWWHETALTVGAAATMGPADDFRRGLRLLGLFSTSRDALLANLRDSAEEPAPEAEVEISKMDQLELKELFRRCDTGRSKHLQIFDIARCDFAHFLAHCFAHVCAHCFENFCSHLAHFWGTGSRWTLGCCSRRRN